MRDWKKITSIAIAAAALVFVAPILYSYCQPRGLVGVYDAGGLTCGCGHELFYYVDQSGCYDYVPGHRDKSLRYTFQQQSSDEWNAVKNGTNACRFRLTGGELYRTFPKNTNWFLMSRVHNIWRIWIPETFAN